MRITTYQQKSPLKQECEDSYFCNEDKNIYGVCDGATPLVPFRDEKEHNGAYIASHLFASHFTSLCENLSLQVAVARANELLQNKMLEYKVDTRKKEHLWCTCIAAVQINGEKIEYAQLGDCMIVAILQNGTMQVVTKDTVKGISKRAKKKREEDRKKGLFVPEEHVFQDVREQLKYNRYLANMEGGYSVANGMKEAIHYLQHGELHIDEVSGIFICSDGLFHPDWSLEQTVAYIRKNSINEYVAIIEELEGEKRIRPDDKTSIMIDF
ncbi:protein phosphatase 2C domain-containing protein [Bacillus toyonensis]|uniref:protein phosphatase 2C domain-containing protein n=1 Tax=Bacillus toyonensis TaxID=155322 RepID=UPI000BF01640|nr:protein phosphatase 2C domain-containing protein [Bacillus toyonensis]MDF9448097.1 protein phosphatase 2C domain-containing protein [Bacillus toyonensis]MDG1562785.1 protein phosphatase 2C domain-containing protein [Bacillus toyonensis]PEO66874.1 serine/threonine protein phosphatase [Bacillus toyonensis]PFX82431.1 serine/threonine protein phosphatase [Bacillus toyonensis]PFX88654.1 serine/threonine protein phosphatase [Bacillus toyonensis]